jgi:ABC-type transport system involved in multi-copper enzyme maturation permease subunit
MSVVRFLRSLRFEAGKAIRARLTWVTLLLPALLTVISVWISEWVRRAQQLTGAEVEGIQSAFAPFSRGTSNGFVLGGILLLFYASMIVANEGTLRTFKITLLRPHARLELLGAKLTLLLLLALALVVCVVASGLGAAALVADYVDIAEEGFVLYTTDFMVQESLRAVLLVLPALAALAAFGLMVSTFSDHTGIAASGCIGAYIFLEALKGTLANARHYLFNSFMPSLLDESYFAALRGFADGLSDVAWEPQWFTLGIVTPLVSALLFATVAAWSFGRRDFLV